MRRALQKKAGDPLDRLCPLLRGAILDDVIEFGISESAAAMISRSHWRGGSTLTGRSAQKRRTV
jgi:hypothetical protein